MGSIDTTTEDRNKASEDLAACRLELGEAQLFLQAILENSDDMIFTTDSDGDITSFSLGGQRLLGYSWEEVQGRAVRSLVVDADKFDRLFLECREEKPSVRSEVDFLHKDRRVVHLDVTLVATRGVDRSTGGTLAICRDTTRLKELKENLIQIDRLAEIGRISAGVAHDINNPLAIIGEIVGWVETMVGDAKGLGTEEKEELETAVKHLTTQTKRCKALTTQLLGFARDATPSLTACDLEAILKDVVSFLKPELKYTTIHVDVAVDADANTVRCDPKKLQQVFVNLLTNAIHAINEKKTEEGSIVIKAGKVGQCVQIAITDNGTGIPLEYQQKAFEIFSTTKPPGKGTGLGLPICRDILEKLGGTISLQSQPGEGTTFTVQLPVS